MDDNGSDFTFSVSDDLIHTSILLQSKKMLTKVNLDIQLDMECKHVFKSQPFLLKFPCFQEWPK